MSVVTIVEERPDTADALALLGELDAYLLALPYPPESRHAFSVEKLLREGVRFFVARVEGRAAGCGGIKFYDDDGDGGGEHGAGDVGCVAGSGQSCAAGSGQNRSAHGGQSRATASGQNRAADDGRNRDARRYGEVKRMFVRPDARGLGLGKAILDRLAKCARQRGVGLLRLETGIYQVEAIGLYERWGFVRRAPFGAYREDPNTIFFEKQVSRAVARGPGSANNADRTPRNGRR